MASQQNAIPVINIHAYAGQNYFAHILLIAFC
jgi:hypothetical protein